MNIPPNWKVIKKAKSPYDSIQATCIAPNGKTQYIYHPLWVMLREVIKFKKLIGLTKALKKYRPENTEMGQILWLMFQTCIRTGNTLSGREHLGLVALKQKNLIVDPAGVFLEFVGKAGVHHNIRIVDRRSIKFLRKKKLTGMRSRNKRLFCVTDSNLNVYLKEQWGSDYTCKDIRTYQANIRLIETLMTRSEKTPRQHFESAVDQSAVLLGHTKSISKKNYLCSAIHEMYIQDPTVFYRARKSSSLLLQCLKHYFKT